MKLNVLSFVCSLALSATLYSCTKNKDVPQNLKPEEGKKEIINIKLSGDITLHQSPLPGARMYNNYVYAKTLADSTIYAVDVRTENNQTIATGIFNNPDSIKLELERGKVFTITVAAFKKGSGLGLWYEMIPGGLQNFGRPLNSALENKMVYGYVDFLNDFAFTDIFAGDTVNPFPAFYPELDAYTSTTSLSIDTSQTLTMPMRRIVFGIKYNAINFTEGKLLVQYAHSMQPKSYTPSTIDNSLSIYSANELRYLDATYSGGERIIVTLKWEKDDGTVINLGDKEMPYLLQRNYIINVNVTLPTTPTTVYNGVGITITDTVWTTSNSINF